MAPKTEGGNNAFTNVVNEFAHIDDPIERRRMALDKIDNAKFGWQHIRAIIVAGVGFFTDAYDIFSINIAVVMMAYTFWQKAALPSHIDTAMKVSTSAGAVVGQFGFGFLADVVGRKRIYGLELMVIIAGTIGQAIAGQTSPGVYFQGVIIFWRVIMGIGIGGDYPLSSIITSEFASTKWRGAMMAAVFANQGWGQFAACIVSLICTAGFKNSLKYANTPAECDGRCRSATDKMWRIVIGMGAVPACFALYYRLTIPESPRYTFDVSRDLEQGADDINKYISNIPANKKDIDNINHDLQKTHSRALSVSVSVPDPETEALEVPKASFKDFWNHYRHWKYGKILIGTAGSWFFIDIAFYGIGLNQSTILSSINYSGQSNVYTNLYNTCVGNIILVVAGAIPGYWFSVATVDIVGRKPIQIGGFFILTALFCILGFGFHKISGHGKLAIYCLCQFFCNWGPNTTTFIVPGEAFPTRYRSTSHGLSAGIGKIGAIIAQCVLGPLKSHGCPASNQTCWMNHVMEIFALFMLCGFFTSWLIPETSRRTLEEICETEHDEIDVVKQRDMQRAAALERENMGSSDMDSPLGSDINEKM